MIKPLTNLYSPAGGEGASSGVPESPTGAAVKASPEDENFYTKISSPADAGDKGASGAGKEEGAEDFSGDDNNEEVIQDPGSEEGAEGGDNDAKEEVVEEAKPQVLKLDPETIAALRGPLQQQTQPKEERQQMTPAQLKEKFAPVEVSAEMLQGLGFENPTPQQIQGFQQFSNAIVKNAVNIARFIVDQKASQFEQALAPLSQFHQQTSEKQALDEFFGSAKDLDRTKHAKIVSLAAREVNPNNADGSAKSPQAIMKEVADIARATLKSLGVSITPAIPSAQDQNNGGKGKVPVAPKFSSSGRSGGDQHSRGGKPNDADADIYRR